ncbi:MAG: hypothetical protein Q4F06_03110 [Eubacteriales bacterium]|nr:hypothetical protein [Eubacteriales bacterium]
MINSVIQALMFTLKFVLGGGGNLDLYYFYAMLVFVFYVCKRTKLLNKIIKIWAFLICVHIVIILFNGIEQEVIRNIVSISKLFINIVLMMFVADNFKKWNLGQIINCISLVLFIEIIFAIIFRESILWRHNDIINVYSKTRLQLLYIEPSELSLHCALVLILIMICVVEKGFKRIFLLDSMVCIVALILSAGMSGIACLVISVCIFYIYKVLRDKRILKKTYKLILIAIVSVIALFFIKKSLFLRVVAILSGKDGSFYARIYGPVKVLLNVLKGSNYMGLGAGMLNTDIGFQMTGLYYKFPNSYMYMIAEYGLFGIITMIGFLWYLFRIAFKKADYVLILLMFLVVFQMIGGYFSNPIFWFGYGIILSYKRDTKEI